MNPGDQKFWEHQDFWMGYRAALDDVERAIVGVDIVANLDALMLRIGRIRADYNLPPRDDTGRTELPESFHEHMREKSQAELVSSGVPEEAAKELLAMASRMGREMSEIDTGEEDDEDDD